MALSQNQKKLIKKNVHSLSFVDLIRKTGTKDEDVLAYLKEKWTKDKFEKYISDQGMKISKFGVKQEIVFNVDDFSFKTWLRENIAVLVFLLFAVLIVYFNSFQNGFVSDDVDGILRNKHIAEWSYATSYTLGFFRNLFMMSIARIFGVVPFWFRFFSIISHIFTVFVVYFIFSLTGRKNLSLIGALFFAIHPIIVESVTWISGGVYTNYTLLLLFAFVFHIFSHKNKYFLSLSWSLFIIALFTSVNAVVFAPMIFIYEFAFSDFKTAIKKTWTYWVILGLFILSAVIPGFMKRKESLGGMFYQESGMDNPLLVVTTAIFEYIRLIFWPKDLTLYHSQLDISNTMFFLRSVFLSIYFYVTYFFYKKNRMIFFWMSFFFVCLLPFMTPFRISWIVAERYVYMSSIAIFFIVAYFFDKFLDNEKVKNILYIVLIVIIVMLGFRTILRNFDWVDADTLYLSMEHVSYNDPKTHNNLGDVYGRRGDFVKSEAEFKKAIELKPNYGDAYFNLGNTYLQWSRDKWASAEANYKMALSLNPDIWQGYAQLAFIYYNVGKYDLAYENIQKSLSLNKESIFSYNLAAMISAARNDIESAKRYLNQAIAINPNDKMTRDNMALLEKNSK